MGLLFFLKKPKNYRNGGLKDVYLKITVDGIPRELSCKRKWESKRWNPHAGRALGLKEDAKELNACLDTLQTLAYDSEGCVPTFIIASKTGNSLIEKSNLYIFVTFCTLTPLHRLPAKYSR